VDILAVLFGSLNVKKPIGSKFSSIPEGNADLKSYKTPGMTEIYEGTSEVQRMVISQGVLNKPT